MTISKRNKKEKQNILRLDHLEVIQPKTHNQQITFDEYHKDQNLVLHGIAGTGKTHTTFGNLHSVTNSETKIEKGICLYAVDYLFDHILNDQSKTYLVKVGLFNID